MKPGFWYLLYCVLFCGLHRGFQDFTIHLRQVGEEFGGRRENGNSSHSQAVLRSEDRHTQPILIDGYKAEQERPVTCVRTALRQRVRGGFSQSNWGGEMPEEMFVQVCLEW